RRCDRHDHARGVQRGEGGHHRLRRVRAQGQEGRVGPQSRHRRADEDGEAQHAKLPSGHDVEGRCLRCKEGAEGDTGDSDRRVCDLIAGEEVDGGEVHRCEDGEGGEGDGREEDDGGEVAAGDDGDGGGVDRGEVDGGEADGGEEVDGGEVHGGEVHDGEDVDGGEEVDGGEVHGGAVPGGEVARGE